MSKQWNLPRDTLFHGIAFILSDYSKKNNEDTISTCRTHMYGTQNTNYLDCLPFAKNTLMLLYYIDYYFFKLPFNMYITRQKLRNSNTGEKRSLYGFDTVHSHGLNCGPSPNPNALRPLSAQSLLIPDWCGTCLI